MTGKQHRTGILGGLVTGKPTRLRRVRASIATKPCIALVLSLLDVHGSHMLHLVQWLAIVATLAIGQLRADTVQFHPGQVAPSLSINPPSPASADIIGFTTPLDGNVHSNSCQAAVMLGGHPFLVRNDVDHTIDLFYDGNIPGGCAALFDPVVGAEGDFGPLAMGDWVFRDPHNNTLQFTVVPEPSTYPLLLIGGLGLLQLLGKRGIR